MASRRSRPRAAGVAVLAALTGLAACGVQRPAAYLAAMAAGERAMHAGRYAEAAQHYATAQQATRRPLDRDEAVYRRAQALRRAGRTSEALAQFDWLSVNGRLEAREDRAAYEAARIRLEAGAGARAEADVLELARRAPDTGVAPRAVEMVLRERDTRDPTGALALAWIAEVWPVLGESSLAPRLWLERARRYERSHDTPNAIRAYEGLLARGFVGNPHYDDGALAYAELLMSEGRHEEAARVCERALVFYEQTLLPVGSNERPRFPALALLRGRALRAAGRSREAAEAFRDAWEDHPHARTRDDAMEEEANVRAQLGDRADACGLWSRLAREFPCSARGRRARVQAEVCGAAAGLPDEQRTCAPRAGREDAGAADDAGG